MCTDTSSKTDPTSHVNYRFLKMGEMRERLIKQHDSIRSLQRKLVYLKSKIAKLTDEIGLYCSAETTADLSNVMALEHVNVSKSYPEGSFQRIFWDQQREACKHKKACSMKWHPLMIKWCLFLRYRSSGAYDLLHESGCIKLPSQRTLRDYTHVVKTTMGFSLQLDQQLKQSADVESLEAWQKCIILILDEMKVREDLVYDKNSDELIGFTNLGDINNHLIEFEKTIDEQPTPTLADSMLVL